MLNPILSFSATRRMRSFRTLLIAGIYVLVMAGAALLMMWPMFGGEVSLINIRAGVSCYQVLMLVQFVLIVLIAPAMTSGAVAGERERQTLELLLVTNTRSFRIVSGKVMESFAMLSLLIVCGFPVMCLTTVAGAVTLTQILAGELFLLVMAFASVCVGVLASTVARSTVASGVISYLIILAIGVIGTLPLFIGFSQKTADIVYDQNALAALSTGETLRMIHPLLFINPGFALAALLQGQTGIFTGTMEYREMGRLLCGFKLMDKAGGETVALISCAAIFAVGVLLLLAAALILRRNAGKPARRTKA